MRREVSERLKQVVNEQAEKMRANGEDVVVELVPTIFIKRHPKVTETMGEGYGGVHHTPLDVVNGAMEYVEKRDKTMGLGKFTKIQQTPTESKLDILRNHYGVRVVDTYRPCICCDDMVNTVYRGKYICSSSCLARIQQPK